MADHNDVERTLPASPRRLEKAREEGQVARSPELAAFAVLMAGGGGVWLAGGPMLSALTAILSGALGRSAAEVREVGAMLEALHGYALSAMMLAAPLFAVLFVTALIAPLLMSGWLFSAKPLVPDFTRLNPVAGFGRIFSVHGLTELGKALAKALVIGAVAGTVLWHFRDAAFALAGLPLATGLAETGRLVLGGFLIAAAAMSLIVAVDVPLQLWRHASKLRMTREEVKEEYKETEGDPQIRSAIRAQQRELARRRMMAEVPKADVVVTNPVHYAVALRYDSATMRAPRVVAKGAHLLAARIRELAAGHGVPVLESPPLARALYHHTDLGEEIPEKLYTAVAEVLAWVFSLRRYRAHGGTEPRPPAPAAVPPGLDPHP